MEQAVSARRTMLPTYQVDGLGGGDEFRGAHLLCLPPYSLDFNSIELAFNKPKTWQRTA